MKKKYFILTIEGEPSPIAIIHTEPPFATNGNNKLPKAYLKFVKETCKLKTSLAISEYFDGEITYIDLTAGKDCIHDGNFTYDGDDYTFTLVETPMY